jgi:hypothetical protein
MLSDHKKTICKEVLNNIKSCLEVCSNNRNTYNLKEYQYSVSDQKSQQLNQMVFDNSISLLECENIHIFNKSLNVVNINIIIKNPIIDFQHQYYIDYNVSKRVVIIDRE